MTRRASRALALFTAATFFVSVPLHAEPSKAEIAAAKRLFGEAEREEAANRWAAALEKLRAVVAIKETAGVRYHLAHCEERLGQLVAALTDYRRAAKLAEATTGADSEDTQRRAANEIAALEPRIPVVKLTLPDDAAGATITLDGKPLLLASPPAPLRLDPGEYRFEAAASGRTPFTQKLILVERGSYEVIVQLQREAPPSAPVTASPAPPSPERPAAPPPRDVPPPETSSGPSAMTYVAGGATLILVGATVAFYAKKSSLEKETEQACQTHCDATARQDSIDQQRTFMYAAGGAAILAAGVTVTLAVTSTSKPKTTTLVVSPTGLTLFSRF
jgi:hypothetical protein